jgi:hypothetical protein
MQKALIISGKVRKSPMEEKELYEPARRFLRSRGFRAVITHGKANVKIWIGDILPYKEYIEADVIGITRSWTDTVCVEAKADIAGKEVFEILGKCMLWRIVARNIYIAMPVHRGLKADALKLLGIGLITVNEKGEAHEAIPPSGYVQQDSAKSQELYNQSLRAVVSEYGVLEVSYASATPVHEGWQIPLEMKNIGTQQIKVLNVLINGKPYTTSNCRMEPVSVLPSSPLEIVPGSEYKLRLWVPKTATFEKTRSIQIDLQVEDGVEKGFSVYLSA